MVKDFIRKVLENSICEDYIVQDAVIKNARIFSPDRRYKLYWKAANCYKKGCTSGILEYMNREYYFSYSCGIINIETI